MPCTPGAANINLGDCFLLNRSGTTVASVYNTPAVLINLLVRYAFIAGGIFMFVLIFYGGYLFITGDIKGKDKAFEVWQSAIVGFIVMFSAYWIVQIIKVITGADINL